MRSWTLALFIVLAVPGLCAAEDPVAWQPLPMDPAMAGLMRDGMPPGMTPDQMAPPPDPATTGNLFEDQYISHWVTFGSTLEATIDEDLIGETTFEGLCSNGNLGGNPDLPSVYASYWSSTSMSTSYYQAYDSSICEYHIENRTRYFYTWVRSDGNREVQVRIGASDYFKFWINGTLTLYRSSGGPMPFTEDQYNAPAMLRDGWNLLLFKHSFPQLGPPDDPNDNNRYKYFSLRFVDGSGLPVHLVAAFDPMCDFQGQDGLNSKILVQSIAHLPGLGGSQWRADTTIYNGTHMRWFLVLRYFREGNWSGVPNAVAELVLDPFDTVTFEDALRNAGLFGVAGDEKGYFEVLHMRSYYFQDNGWLQTKVYNQGPSGTFGMDIPARYYYNGTNWSASFFGLRHGDYRTNFGMVPWDNAGASVRVRLTLFGPDFAAPAVAEVGPFEGMFQINNLFRELGVAGMHTTTATLYLQFLDNPTETRWFPYVAINDGNPQGTSDPIFFKHGWFAAWPPALNK